MHDEQSNAHPGSSAGNRRDRRILLFAVPRGSIDSLSAGDSPITRSGRAAGRHPAISSRWSAGRKRIDHDERATCRHRSTFRRHAIVRGRMHSALVAGSVEPETFARGSEPLGCWSPQVWRMLGLGPRELISSAFAVSLLKVERDWSSNLSLARPRCGSVRPANKVVARLNANHQWT